MTEPAQDTTDALESSPWEVDFDSEKVALSSQDSQKNLDKGQAEIILHY